MADQSRPVHAYWIEGGFKQQYETSTGKLMALCTTCDKIITNTAEQRLRTHR